MAELKIKDILAARHNAYDLETMQLYRLTYTGGKEFIERFLRKHFQEERNGWMDRKALTYNPEYAAEAVDEYVRAIAQRASDIKRIGGSDLYLRLVKGENNGVDRNGSTLDAFFARNVIPELLAMGKVGVYIENDSQVTETLADARYPFLYTYRTEDILNWSYNQENPSQLDVVHLLDRKEKINAFGLNDGFSCYHRIVARRPNGILVEIYDEDGKLVKSNFQDTEFPFVVISLSRSLLHRTARHQIALLNLCSSDLYYAWGSNFPIYVEQSSDHEFNRMRETRLKSEDTVPTKTVQDAYSDLIDGAEYETTPKGSTAEHNKIRIGQNLGRRYAKGTERPGFIHPSTEPLTASMEKEKQLKEEIRQLTALSVASLTPASNISASAKELDNVAHEAGMTFIGKTLEVGENQIAKVYHSYLSSPTTPTRANYPEKYNLKTDEDRRKDAEQLIKLQSPVPSRLYQKTISKKIVKTMFEETLNIEELNAIYAEIDDAKVPTSDPDILRNDHEAGFVSDKTASEGRGYLPGESKVAAEDHAERLARIQEAQTNAMAARGVPDADPNVRSADEEKEISQDGDLDKGGRGPAK